MLVAATGPLLLIQYSTWQRMVVSTLKLVETFIARGETCDALSRSSGQLNLK